MQILGRNPSDLHPALYALRVRQRALSRQMRDWPHRSNFAAQQVDQTLPFVVYRHQSLLRRKLGESDPILQENKVVNLGLARQPIDGILIHPGQTFSFWRRVGEANARKGYLPGMRLSRGEVKVGVGGGLCQLGNLIYWMALHSPLEVTERHHHSFDPFPDEGRVLPFGSGASLFFPFLDLRLHNPTAHTFQLRIWLTETHLKGLLACSTTLEHSRRIEEREHMFLRRGDDIFRRNELWRRVIDRATGQTVLTEPIMRNLALVKYPLPADIVLHDEEADTNRP